MIKLVERKVLPMPQNNELTSMVEAISNFGIMLIIAAVIVIFLARVLNSMLARDEALISSLVPKLEEMGKQISALQSSVNDVISSHNSKSVQGLRDLSRDNEDIIREINYTKKEIKDLQYSVNELRDHCAELASTINYHKYTNVKQELPNIVDDQIELDDE